MSSVTNEGLGFNYREDITRVQNSLFLLKQPTIQYYYIAVYLKLEAKSSKVFYFFKRPPVNVVGPLPLAVTLLAVLAECVTFSGKIKKIGDMIVKTYNICKNDGMHKDNIQTDNIKPKITQI
jgi:hypothetical protein